MVRGQSVVLQMVTEELAGIDRHWAVKIYRHIPQAAIPLKAGEIVKEGLGPPDGEGRNDNCSTATSRSFNYFSEHLDRIQLRMLAVTISGLHDDVVSLTYRPRSPEKTMRLPPHSMSAVVAPRM